MSVQQFLEASGRSEEALLTELTAEADRSVRVDLALRALADAEDIQVTDEELDAVVADMATRMGTTPKELSSRLDRAGRLPAVRSDQRKSKALNWLLDHVELVDSDGNPVSRDDLRAESGESGPGDAPRRTAEGDVAGGDSDEGGDDVRSEEHPTMETEDATVENPS